MENENKLIHEFDIQLICEYFSLIERQGPGSPDVTKKALGFIDNLTNESKIADIGCGTGGQTLVLAQNSPGQLTGIDLFPQFIALLNKNTKKQNLENKVRGIEGSMENLPFIPKELDLIWSEGAIYNIGFKRGLREWREFLKPGGHVAVSEACWFTNKRPGEIEQFWQEAYPEIDTIPRKVEQLQAAGYQLIACFSLPENCWIDHYYKPQEKAQKQFLLKHKGNKMAEQFVSSEKHEAQLYYKHKAHYGYVFFIGKKV